MSSIFSRLLHSDHDAEHLLGQDLEGQNRSGIPGPGLSAGERRILESLHHIHRKLDNLMITQAQFDGDLADFFTAVTGYITAAEAQSAAQTQAISDLNAQIVTLEGEVVPVDLSVEDQGVADAKARVITALQTIPTVPGAVPAPIAPVSATTGTQPANVQASQAANAVNAPEQSAPLT